MKPQAPARAPVQARGIAPDNAVVRCFEGSSFRLYEPFAPAGDQPQAIEQLCQSLAAGHRGQTLLGVTGSGKTYTLAQVIARRGTPAMVMAHNKTLAAQLYGELRDFFPDNHVEYFVSYYDYYQPEAYVPSRDLYIEKDSSVNSYIEQMRLAATKNLMEHRDVIIVCTVSAIYGIGDPVDYKSMVLHLFHGEKKSSRNIIRRLVEMQYERSEYDFSRGRFRVRGDRIDIFPAENADHALRVELFDDEVESLFLFDPLTGNTVEKIERFTIYPSSHYVSPRDNLLRAMDNIRQELAERLEYFYANNRLVEAQRLSERTRFDLEMMQEIGFCKGIENYSRHLSRRQAGEPPPTLIDYLPHDALMVIDESHVTIGQIGAMYKGDRTRKENLVQYGFRLPSALDNRPLMFHEFEKLYRQVVWVSATPADYEYQHSQQVVEQVVRPTGLIDPIIVVKSADNQIDDLLLQIEQKVILKERVLVTTLTKKMAEQLAAFLHDKGIRVRYMHADIDTVERMEIIRDLRLGHCDVLVGINLLREGLDIPEVSLVAILDADKEGFLRSRRSLIQTIGRAARHVKGTAILYANTVTNSMQQAIAETERRRGLQLAHNQRHGITPQGIHKSVRDILGYVVEENDGKKTPLLASGENIMTVIAKTEKQMFEASKKLDYERAAQLRDELFRLRGLISQLS